MKEVRNGYGVVLWMYCPLCLREWTQDFGKMGKQVQKESSADRRRRLIEVYRGGPK